MEKTYAIRMFIRPSLDKPGKFLGVCTGPYLVVEGDDLNGTCEKLRALLTAYLEDAWKDGDLEEAVSKRAPWSYRFEYYILSAAIRVRSAHAAITVSEARTFTPQHA